MPSSKQFLHLEMEIGPDLVHDQVEHALLKEVEVVRNCENKLEHFTDKCVDQVCLKIKK